MTAQFPTWFAKTSTSAVHTCSTPAMSASVVLTRMEHTLALAIGAMSSTRKILMDASVTGQTILVTDAFVCRSLLPAS